MIRTKHLLPSSLLLIAAGCTSGPGSLAGPLEGTIEVDQSGSGHFRSIQSAIDAAAPGARIQIGSGVYMERLIVDKNLTLVGSGSSTVVVALGPSQPEGSATAATLVIRDTDGMTVQDMSFDNGPDDGILVRNSTNITLINVTASGNADDGIDIRSSSDVSVSGSTFNDNGDRGVRIRDNSTMVLIDDSEMSDNAEDGVRIRESDHVTVQSSTMSNNGQSGIRVRDAMEITITGGTITDNTEWGIRLKAAMITNADDLLTDNTVTGNGEGPTRID